MKKCQKKGILLDKDRRCLLNFIVDLLVEKCGNLYPNLFTKISIAKATLKLFPVFTDNDSKDGIVS